MATNYIKIEVDYTNAKVKIGDLKMSFDELGERATATRNRINKAYKSTENAMKGSLKALQREREGWINLQQSLSTTNAVYSKYQAQIDKLDAKIAKMTDTRSREERALKNSANGLRAQIAAMQTEMDNRILSNKQYRIANEQLQILKDRLEALTDTRKEHEIVQQGSVAHYEQEISIRMQALRNMNLEAEQVERLEQEIVSLNARKAEAAAKSQMLNKAMAGTSSSAGAAGSAVTELGRTIGDAPFGLMGMANNIQQLSQQFVDLQTKTGGTKQALQSMLATMTGPAGIVVAINVVTSALVAYNMRKDKAKQKTEDFNESLLLEKNTLEALNALYEDGADNLENRAIVIGALAVADDKYAEALDALGKNEEARNALTEQYLKDRNALNVAEDKRNKIAEKNKDLLTNELLTEEERIRIEQELEILRNSKDRGNATTIAQKEKMLEQDDKLIEVNKQLAQSTIEVNDAQKQLDQTLGVSAIDEFAEKEREFIKEREKTLALLGLEGTAAIQKEIDLLNEDYEAALAKYGVNSIQAGEAKLALDEKKLELQVEQAEQADEAAKAEADRLKELAELNQEYVDNIEAHGDELGIIKLNQAERDAIAQAEALGAGHDLIIKITQDFANQRQKILDDAAEKEAEKARKAAEKQAEEEKKIKEKALKDNEKKIEEYFQREIDLMKDRTDKITEILQSFSTILDELDNISQARFDRQMAALNTERENIKANANLTTEEKNRELAIIQQRENEAQIKRIKAERNMFTIKQTLVIAEMVLKQRAFVQEMIMMANMQAMLAKLTMTEVQLTAAKETGKAQMSLGTFMSTLGPLGVAAFAASIGGVIASIIAARKQANAEIAGLTGVAAPAGGSASTQTPSVPDFNVVGASGQNQLAEAIGMSNKEPLRAYVVSSDVTSAQEMDRKIVEGASI